MNLQPITEANDPRVVPYRDIRERDLRAREGLFIAEGEVVLRVLSNQSRHRCISVLIDGRRLDKLAPILGALPQTTPIYVAERSVIDTIAGFALHRGILALGEEAEPHAPDILIANAPEPAVLLALYGIANHDNMGGLFRNAAAVGVHAVLLDETCCDPLYRKAIRVSVGAALSVPFARWTGEPPFDLMERLGFEILALSPTGSIPLSGLTPPFKAVVALGAEGPGLPAAFLKRSLTVSIPMAKGWDSLNVATASGIVLQHLSATRA